MPHPQPTHGPVTDNAKPTTGGNRTLINGNELVSDDECIDKMKAVYSELGEDDSHVQGEYRRHASSMEY